MDHFGIRRNSICFVDEFIGFGWSSFFCGLMEMLKLWLSGVLDMWDTEALM